MAGYSNFNLIADALLLYYQNRNSLFAEQVIADKLHESPEIIRSKIWEWLHSTPEELVTHLEPFTIKRIIAKTSEALKNSPTEPFPKVNIESMTQEELAHGGEALSIHYQIAPTSFGKVIIASTIKGICYLAFSDEEDEEALIKLKSRFPNAVYKEKKDDFQYIALSLFEDRDSGKTILKLHLKGTPFQINTWRKLLQIPAGGLLSYSSMTEDIKDSHALGAAVGSNPVAYIIPCHRTVRASGEFGEYHWRQARKAALICLEAIQSGR